MQRESEDANLYVRWDREGAFSIEVRLGLLERLTTEIGMAASSGVEIGGILLGTLPTEEQPILRIARIHMLPRTAGDSAVLLPDPREHEQFVIARWEASKAGRVPVGFFRTHLRGGPMRPSLADRTLLAGEFDTSAYALLLCSPAWPHSAQLFLGSKGELADQPSVPPFALNPRELHNLPQPEIENTTRGAVAPPALRRRTWPRSVAAIAIVMTLAAAIWTWAGVPAFAANVTNLVDYRRASDPGLSIHGGPTLQIRWNPNAACVMQAQSAKLTISEDDADREITLTSSELRDGVIEYQRRGTSISITLALDLGASSVVQTGVWRSGA